MANLAKVATLHKEISHYAERAYKAANGEWTDGELAALVEAATIDAGVDLNDFRHDICSTVVAKVVRTHQKSLPETKGRQLDLDAALDEEYLQNSNIALGGKRVKRADATPAHQMVRVENSSKHAEDSASSNSREMKLLAWMMKNNNGDMSMTLGAMAALRHSVSMDDIEEA